MVIKIFYIYPIHDIYHDRLSALFDKNISIIFLRSNIFIENILSIIARQIFVYFYNKFYNKIYYFIIKFIIKYKKMIIIFYIKYLFIIKYNNGL